MLRQIIISKPFMNLVRSSLGEQLIELDKINSFKAFKQSGDHTQRDEFSGSIFHTDLSRVLPLHDLIESQEIDNNVDHYFINDIEKEQNEMIREESVVQVKTYRLKDNDLNEDIEDNVIGEPLSEYINILDENIQSKHQDENRERQKRLCVKLRLKIHEYKQLKQSFMAYIYHEKQNLKEMFDRLRREIEIKQNNHSKILINNQQYQAKYQQLQRVITEQSDRMKELQRQKEQLIEEYQRQRYHSINLQHINSLNNEQMEDNIRLLEGQNQEYKQEIQKLHQGINNLQAQLSHLQAINQKNGQEIFDLEQRVIEVGLHFNEKQIVLKRQLEDNLIRERQNLREQFFEQFQKIKQELKLKLNEEMANDLIQAKQAFQQQKQYYNLTIAKNKEEISELSKEKAVLSEENRLLKNQIKEIKTKLDLEISQRKKQIKLNAQVNQQQFNKKNKNFKDISEIQVKISDEQNQNKQKQSVNNQFANKYSHIHHQHRRSQYSKQSQQINKGNKVTLNSQKSFFNLNENLNITNQNYSISPSSYSHLRDQKIKAITSNELKLSKKDLMVDNILSRIRMKHGSSVFGELNDSRLGSFVFEDNLLDKNMRTSIIRPVSPESVLLQKEKDLKMKHISDKLQQLRTDIRREIGQIKCE